MTTGAAKPAYIFGISIGVLLAGTLFSRIADGKAQRPAGVISQGHANAMPARVVRIRTPFVTGTAEAAVLHKIAESLANYPDSQICVEWTETYRGHQRPNRATYFPDRRILRCEQVGYSSCEYNPVSPAAIDRVLHDTGDAALFASANLYSMSRADRGEAGSD